MYIITVRRITSGELLKQRKGLRIAGGYGSSPGGSSQFSLTMPPVELCCRFAVALALQHGNSELSEWSCRRRYGRTDVGAPEKKRRQPAQSRCFQTGRILGRVIIKLRTVEMGLISEVTVGRVVLVAASSNLRRLILFAPTPARGEFKHIHGRLWACAFITTIVIEVRHAIKL